jgi:membrane protease YdiL (CAAX protease family)
MNNYSLDQPPAISQAPSGISRLGRKEWWRQVLGVVLGPGLVYAYIIALSADYFSESWLYSFTHSYILHYIIWLVFQTGVLCAWLWLIFRFVCRDHLSSLTRKPSTLRSDLLDGAAIALIMYITTTYVEGFAEIYFHTQDSARYHELQKAAATNLTYFLFNIGPTTWIASAFGEEFRRVILLIGLWRLGSNKWYKIATIALSTLLFGFCHIYQGSTGVVSAAYWGLVAGIYYLYFGRPWALIISHGLYDTMAGLPAALHYLHQNRFHP